MKRIAIVFLLSILIPALLLAALAIRSIRDQETVINTQKALVHQSTCDTLVTEINLFLDDVRVFYGETVDELVREDGSALTDRFHSRITGVWAQAAAGAVVTSQGEIVGPDETSGESAAAFLRNHSAFLGGGREVEVYHAPRVLNRQVQVIEQQGRAEAESSFSAAPPEPVAQAGEEDRSTTRALADIGQREEGDAPDRAVALPSQRGSKQPQAMPAPRAWSPASSPPDVPESAESFSLQKKETVSQKAVTLEPDKLKNFQFKTGLRGLSESLVDPAADPGSSAEIRLGRSADGLPPEVEISEEVAVRTRNVVPELSQGGQELAADSFGGALPGSRSRLSAEVVQLEELAREETEGAVSRLIDGDLHVLLWKQAAGLPGFTFWTELSLEAIRADLGGLFEADRLPGTDEVEFALLDTGGLPVATTAASKTRDWSRPFVASEVGQILPRWEVAAYLLNPEVMTHSARTTRLTIGLIVLVLLGAVAVGCFLVLKSVNYEMRLAARKTDFVSNVSHELKTPLTSIRMFSELLAGSREQDPAQTRKYSEVISRESARLTRLINRLLDFSRLDRGEWKLQRSRIDLSALVEETMEMYRAGMEHGDWEIEVDAGEGVMVDGDRDALSQVLLNLLSNAEKYAAGGGPARVEVSLEEGGVLLAVHDRGPGIPRAHRGEIFEKFYRIDQSIDSGIEGSGIGLALCRQIAENLGGSIEYRNREGGGSSFLVRLPLPAAT